MYNTISPVRNLQRSMVPPPDANVSQVDWISDDVLPVSPKGKKMNMGNTQTVNPLK